MERRKPRKAKKFRSQILAEWIMNNFPKCRVADIGGGKGLLTYILNTNGWQSIVIDPEHQILPTKYTDLNKKRIRINPEESVPHLDESFSKEMAKDFDLLVGLHAHGSCIYIIEAAKEYNKDFVLLPCCVIGEPIEKKPNVNWKDSLFDMANSLNLKPQQVKLNFMGKDIAIYTKNHL